MRFTGNGITNCYPDEVDNFVSITVLTARREPSRVLMASDPLGVLERPSVRQVRRYARRPKRVAARRRRQPRRRRPPGCSWPARRGAPAAGRSSRPAGRPSRAGVAPFVTTCFGGPTPPRPGSWAAPGGRRAPSGRRAIGEAPRRASTGTATRIPLSRTVRSSATTRVRCLLLVAEGGPLPGTSGADDVLPFDRADMTQSRSGSNGKSGSAAIREISLACQ